MNTFLEHAFLNNTIKDWLIATLITLSLYLGLIKGLRFFHDRLRHLASLSKRTLDDIIIKLLDSTQSFFLFIASIYIGIQFVELHPKIQTLLHFLLVLFTFYQIGEWGKIIISYWIQHTISKKAETDKSVATTVGLIQISSTFALYSLLLLIALNNLGVNITALIAGMGVGGVAIALAVQNILGDLFASLTIVIDKPFIVGDFIALNDFKGTIEHLGLNTTRLRSLNGEEIIIPNGDLIKSRIRNYKRMQERRIIFQLGVTYQTSHGHLEKIPMIIKSTIEKQQKTRFDRSHFSQIGPSSLDFETVYYVLSADYKTYMDIQQAILLELFRQFSQLNIEFAYPTHTIFMETWNKN